MPNVTAHIAAVGDIDGITEIFIEENSGIPTDASIILRDPTKIGNLRSVKACDIRELIKERVDLIKLDIEGAEYDCIEVWDLNPEIIRCLVVEFHDYQRGTSRINRSLCKLNDPGYSLLDKQKRGIDLPLIPQNDSELIWAIAP